MTKAASLSLAEFACSWFKDTHLILLLHESGERLMPHYELYAGDNPLRCHIGLHVFESDECVFCNYHPNKEFSQAVTVEE